MILQWTLLERIYDLFVKYPFAFILIPIVWIGLIYFLKEVLGVYVSPWWALMALAVSVGIVIGILLLFTAQCYRLKIQAKNYLLLLRKNINHNTCSKMPAIKNFIAQSKRRNKRLRNAKTNSIEGGFLAIIFNDYSYYGTHELRSATNMRNSRTRSSLIVGFCSDRLLNYSRLYFSFSRQIV